MIILMGLAGSGKSTQGQLLAAARGMRWLSAGQVLRDTGQFDEIMKAGELVDNMTTVKLMAEAMAATVREGQDAILDGFPRDIEQAEWMAENIAEVIRQIVIIEVPRDELLRRLELRGRADDTREAIMERFRITEENMAGICRVLGERGVRIARIDGVGTVEEVQERLMRAVEAENEESK